MVKPLVRQMESEDGVLIFDDRIEEKPHTDENEIICWHYDHTKGRNVKGLNFLTTMYYSQEVSLPVAFRWWRRPKSYLDKKSDKEKRRSPTTKNEHYRKMLKGCVDNRLPFRYVLNDGWYAAAENMMLIRHELDRHFIMALKSNRKVALSEEDKSQGRYQTIS